MLVFWDQYGYFWIEFIGNIDYFVSCCYFQIEFDLGQFVKVLYIVILNVMMVFVQMYCYVIGFIEMGFDGFLDWVWFIGMMGLMQGGDMVDIDVKFNYNFCNFLNILWVFSFLFVK